MSTAQLGTVLQHIQRLVVAHGPALGTDHQLLEDFLLRRDESAFVVLVARHGPMVLRVCRRVLPHEHDVEDAFQATFLVLARRAGSIRKREAVAEWLHGVAYRTAMKAKRSAARRRNHEAHLRNLPPKTAAGPRWDDVQAALDQEIQRLPEVYRSAFVLRILEGKSGPEAAAELGIKEGTVSSRLTRARQRLRQQLARRGTKLTPLLAALSIVEGASAAGVPGILLDATIRSGLLVAAGEPATGVIPVHVAALAAGVTRAMFLTKAKIALTVLLAGSLFALGAGMLARQVLATPPEEAKPQAAAKRPPEVKRRTTGKEDGIVDVRGRVLDPAGHQPAAPVKNAEVKSVPISGKVVGPDGKPVPRAKLFIFDSEEWKPAPQAEANSNGGFAFELPPLADRRSYRYLVATAPGLGLGCDWTGVAAATVPLRDAVLKLPKDEPICGRLIDLEGKPVVGAKVGVTDLQTGKDDTLNEFVRVWSKNKEKQQQALRTLQGKRLYAKKATVSHFSAATGADGRFTLAGIGRDRCPQLTVRAKGKASQVCIVAIRSDFKPAPGAVTGSPVCGPEFTLPLAPSRPITGVVRDAQKKPLAGVRVLGQADWNDTTLFGYLILPDVETITDAEGRYTLDGLPTAKNYVLVADPKPGDGPVYQFVRRGDDAPGLAALTADFDLPRGVVLTGQITDRKSGKSIRGYVFYRPLWANQWVKEHPGYDSPGIAPWCSNANAWTDADGRFRLTAVPGPGILHVQVLGHEMEREYVPAKLAPEDDTDEIVHKDFGLMKTFKTSGQGGGYGPSNLNAYRVLRIPADAKAFTAEATVDPGVNRVVRIVDPDGKPLSGAWVLNERSFGGLSQPLAGPEFTVYALAADQPRRVYAQHDGKRLAGFVSLDGKETGPVVLRLGPTATVTGRVVDPDGLPLKDFRISPAYDDPEIGILLNTRDNNSTTPVFTGADGRFTLANIPAGLTVWFDARKVSGKYLGHSTAKQTLKPGQTLDLGDWKPK